MLKQPSLLNRVRLDHPTFKAIIMDEPKAKLVTDVPAKHKTSELYFLCTQLFGKEFNGYFTAPRTVFRDWLNAKTGLSVDHIRDKHGALDAWLDKLKTMSKSG